MSAGGPQVRDYAYYKAVFRGRRMPFAFVDLDLLDDNIASVVRRAGGKLVRVASKSVRCLSLLRRILAADPGVRGVLCYSASEAAYLSRHGLDDLVVGYPIWDDGRIREVAEEVRKGKRVTLMADSPEHIERLGAIARDLDVVLPVCLDADMSSRLPGLHFGVLRSPLARVDQVLGLLARLEAEPHLKLDGVMGYEAQIAGLPDDLRGRPLMSWTIRALKKRSVREVAERRAAIVGAIRDRGHALRFVNGGGTGSLETTCLEACVTEVSAGSGFYSPALFDGYRRFRHRPAAAFAIEVTRRPAERIFTCHGGGYVASGAAGRDRLPSPYLPEGAALLPAEGAGEVQTPIRYEGTELGLGDPVFMRHAKAGELCEHFGTLLLVSQGRIVDEAATYRGEGHCFL